MPRPTTRNPDQQVIHDLVTEAVERFMKNHCSEEHCEQAKEGDMIKKMVFDPAAVRRIHCSACERYGIPVPKEARSILKHLMYQGRKEPV